MLKHSLLENPPCTRWFSQQHPFARHVWSTGRRSDHPIYGLCKAHVTDHIEYDMKHATVGLLPIGSVCMPYMVTFTINLPQMLAYIPYIDPSWVIYGPEIPIDVIWTKKNRCYLPTNMGIKQSTPYGGIFCASWGMDHNVSRLCVCNTSVFFHTRDLLYGKSQLWNGTEEMMIRKRLCLGQPLCEHTTLSELDWNWVNEVE